MEPYVFIIDLDGTIIGDCSYQCDIYNIQNIMKNKIKIFRTDKAKCETILKNSYNKKSLLIRPYFNVFMTMIKKIYPQSYIFVYTASEKEWAIKEINIIEKENNIKFNRPIFTRDNCILDKDGNIKKSVEKIMPMIKKTMKVNKNYDISKRLLIIDNNPTFIDYHNNFLLCPSYNYIKFNNLWDGLSENYFKCSDLKKFIKKMTEARKMHNIPHTYNQEKQEKIYKWLYKKHKNINKYNSSYINDTFWRDIIILIKYNNVKEFNKNIISHMVKSIKV